jgi:hypothetical protein
MSVQVSLDKLAEQLARFGTSAYLLTVGDDGRPHSVAVEVAWSGSAFALTTGRSSTANLAARPLVSLLWPALEAGGYSLIVDGDGAIATTGATVTPTRAVLHRPATPEAVLKPGCGGDCVPLVA